MLVVWAGMHLGPELAVKQVTDLELNNTFYESYRYDKKAYQTHSN